MASRRIEELERIAAEEGNHTREGDGGNPGPKQEGTEDGDFLQLLQRPVKVTLPDDTIPTRVKPPKEPAKPAESRPKPAGRATASERELGDIAEQLEDKVGTIVGLVYQVAPVTSVYAAENSSKAITALISIGKRHPAMLAGLKKVADGADAMEIGKFILGLLMCIQVDTGRLNGDEFPARMFGVTEILETHFNPENQEKPVNQNVTEMKVPDALRYQPI